MWSEELWLLLRAPEESHLSQNLHFVAQVRSYYVVLSPKAPNQQWLTLLCFSWGDSPSDETGSRSRFPGPRRKLLFVDILRPRGWGPTPYCSPVSGGINPFSRDLCFFHREIVFVIEKVGHTEGAMQSRKSILAWHACYLKLFSVIVIQQEDGRYDCWSATLRQIENTREHVHQQGVWYPLLPLSPMTHGIGPNFQTGRIE